MKRDSMSEHELDRLLSLASRPKSPAGAEARLLARMGSADAPSNVIAFKPKQAPPQRALSWLAALPFAASLALGLWLGIVGLGTGLLPASLGGDATAAADDAVFSGIDDAEVLAEENQT
jgi:hypothetical protein